MARQHALGARSRELSAAARVPARRGEEGAVVVDVERARLRRLEGERCARTRSPWASAGCAGARCRYPGRGVAADRGQLLCSGLVDAGRRDAGVPWARALPRQRSRRGLLRTRGAPAMPAGSEGDVLAQRDEAGPRAAGPLVPLGATGSSPSQRSSAACLREG